MARVTLIAIVYEMEQGVDNLWKRGRPSGRRDYPKFGKHIPNSMLKAF